MVHPAIKPDSPRAARWLIEVCARGIYTEELIGDLEEGFHHRRLGRADSAAFWYWSQVLRSAPLLLARRVRQVPAQRVGLLLLAYLTALLAINIWESEVSRKVVDLIATQEARPPLFAIHALYYTLFSLGALGAGVLAAAIGFRSTISFKKNLALTIAPVFGVVLALITLRAAISADVVSIAYQLIRPALLAPAMIFGACIYGKIRARGN